MSFRAAFLIVAAAVILHVSFLGTCILLIGYSGLASLDEWLIKRAKEKVIEDETSGWTVDRDDAEWEEKGNWTRVKLPNKEQIIVTRVAQLLRRIP
jgi:hypothetical protein